MYGIRMRLTRGVNTVRCQIALMTNKSRLVKTWARCRVRTETTNNVDAYLTFSLLIISMTS
jgi:hypothetical protein